MWDAKIERLNLSIENAGGQEHRIQPIAARAAAVFAERLEDCWADKAGTRGEAALDSLAAAPVQLQLDHMSDEEAASKIANAWLEALVLKLKF